MRQGFLAVVAVAVLLLVAGCGQQVGHPAVPVGKEGFQLPSESQSSEQPPQLPPAAESSGDSPPAPPSGG